MCLDIYVCINIKIDNKRRNEFEERGTICYNKRFKTTFSYNEFWNTKQFDETEETLSVYIARRKETRKSRGWHFELILVCVRESERECVS